MYNTTKHYKQTLKHTFLYHTLYDTNINITLKHGQSSQPEPSKPGRRMENILWQYKYTIQILKHTAWRYTIQINLNFTYYAQIMLKLYASFPMFC